jgi:hypothetical protein
MVGANETFFQVAPIDSRGDGRADGHSAQPSTDSSSISSAPTAVPSPSRRAPVPMTAQP